MALTILDGSTFCISADDGAIEEGSHGFYAQDTRFLSRLAWRVNGEAPWTISAGKVEYFAAAFFLRHGASGGRDAEDLLIRLERFVTDDLQDHLVVANLTDAEVALDVSIELASDFADILSIKQHDFALGDPAHATALPVPVGLAGDGDSRSAVLTDPSGAWSTRIRSSRTSRIAASALHYELTLAPRAEWDVRLMFRPRIGREKPERRRRAHHFGEQRERVSRSLHAWNLQVPRLEATWSQLEQAYGRSVADLAALRLHGAEGIGLLPAAGMPWFMTVFGRDTVLTCLETLIFGPELARAALRALAKLQAQEDDPAIDAEPGKIIHELRRGRAAEVWFARYYGTVDATPLFLVLLSEVWRWTRDDALVRELEPAMRLALRWIDEFGDRDGDGFVEFARRSDHGLAVQSWKDSPDSQRFADGRIAEGPIASVEVQGYVYDAKLRVRRARPRCARGRASRRAARTRRRRTARAFRPLVLGRGRRRRVLRARARRAETPGRQPLLQHGAPPVERHRSRWPGRRARPRAPR